MCHAITQLHFYIVFCDRCEYSEQYYCVTPLHNYISTFCFVTGVNIVNSTATEIEQLASHILSTALAVRKAPHDADAVERLGIERQQWSAKIHALTTVIDDITDVREFVDVTGELDFVYLPMFEFNAHFGIFLLVSWFCVQNQRFLFVCLFSVL